MKAEVLEEKQKPTIAITEGKASGDKGSIEDVVIGFHPTNYLNFISDDLANEICDIGVIKKKVNFDGNKMETKGACGLNFMLDSKNEIVAMCHVVDSSLIKGVDVLLGNSVLDGYGLKIKETRDGKEIDLSGYRNLT